MTVISTTKLTILNKIEEKTGDVVHLLPFPELKKSHPYLM